jgi:hypothetical protein
MLLREAWGFPNKKELSMNKKHNWLILLLLVIAAFAGGAVTPGIFMNQSIQAQKSREIKRTDTNKWENLVIRANSPEEIIDKANSLGEQGWELVNALPYDPRYTAYVAYLKRPKQ